jgi:hypothetical protein
MRISIVANPLVLGILASMLLACGQETGPSTVLVLQNDSFDGTVPPVYNDRFISGQAVSVFFPARSGTFKVRDVRFVYGPADTPREITLTLEVVRNMTRGVIFSANYTLTPTDAGFQEIDLPGGGVDVALVGAGVRVSIFFHHAGLPTVARDDDGPTPNRNFVYVPDTWERNDDGPLFPGDWIIRIEIEE